MASTQWLKHNKPIPVEISTDLRQWIKQSCEQEESASSFVVKLVRLACEVGFSLAYQGHALWPPVYAERFSEHQRQELAAREETRPPKKHRFTQKIYLPEDLQPYLISLTEIPKKRTSVSGTMRKIISFAKAILSSQTSQGNTDASPFYPSKADSNRMHQSEQPSLLSAATAPVNQQLNGEVTKGLPGGDDTSIFREALVKRLGKHLTDEPDEQAILTAIERLVTLADSFNALIRNEIALIPASDFTNPRRWMNKDPWEVPNNQNAASRRGRRYRASREEKSLVVLDMRSEARNKTSKSSSESRMNRLKENAPVVSSEQKLNQSPQPVKSCRNEKEQHQLDTEIKLNRSSVGQRQLQRNNLKKHMIAEGKTHQLQKRLKSFQDTHPNRASDLLMQETNLFAEYGGEFLGIFLSLLQNSPDDLGRDNLETAELLLDETILTAELCRQMLKDKHSTNNH